MALLGSPTAVVTGAGSGLGRGVTECLHAQGWRMLGTVRRDTEELAFVCGVVEDAWQPAP